jgi:hypothetical protein
MVFEKVEARAKGVRALVAQTPLFTLRLNFNETNGAPNGKRGMGLFKGKTPFKQRGTEVKATAMTLCVQQMFHLKLLLIAKKKPL